MPSTEKIGARFVVRGSALGFHDPPVPLRLKIVKSQNAWSLYVQLVSAGTPGQVLDWLSAWLPHRIDLARNGVLRADLPTPPSEWVAAFAGVSVDLLTLTPDGLATATVSGTRAGVQEFAARLALGEHSAVLRHTSAMQVPKRLLTPPQMEALRAAVVSGYYRIPRLLNLHELAASLGITAASLSERLRRAEGRVITRFVDAETADTTAPTDVSPETADSAPHQEIS